MTAATIAPLLPLSDSEYDDCLSIVDALQWADARGMTASEIGRRAGLDTLTVKRLLPLVIEDGQGHQNPLSRRYYPGRGA